MKQETNDVILNVTTEWEKYEVRLNWDVDGKELIRHFTNIMKGMTYTTYSIIEGLKEVAEDMSEEIKLYNKFNEEEYGTTNQEGTDN